jgi:hypothetical protein
MVTLNNQKRAFAEQFQENLIYYYKGGQFTATQERISFCQAMVDNHQEDMVLVDDNQTPILVDDLTEFKNELINTYFSAANKYLTSYNKLRQNRSVKGIID